MQSEDRIRDARKMMEVSKQSARSAGAAFNEFGAAIAMDLLDWVLESPSEFGTRLKEYEKKLEAARRAAAN